MKIANNVHMLKIDNYYLTLLWDEQNLVLVDAGLAEQHEALVDAIKAAGFDPAKITHIIYTHQDGDHVGGGPSIVSVAANAQTMAHVDEAPYIDGRKTPTKLATALANYDNLDDAEKAEMDKIVAKVKTRAFPLSKTLTDGEVLPICGGIEIIHTPGHTPGHICLFLQESCIMVLGDAASIENGALTGFNPQYIQDLELADKSIEKLRKYPMQGAVGYHSGFFKIG
ncbi:MAG: MBL fold metallo-hydrolase [Defluviitaleaceae bacterium]|nr:MBL fold metallo-hydrolase [Defluviitaleaceae bacterium]